MIENEDTLEINESEELKLDVQVVESVDPRSNEDLLMMWLVLSILCQLLANTTSKQDRNEPKKLQRGKNIFIQRRQCSRQLLLIY